MKGRTVVFDVGEIHYRCGPLMMAFLHRFYCRFTGLTRLKILLSVEREAHMQPLASTLLRAVEMSLVDVSSSGFCLISGAVICALRFGAGTTNMQT